MQVILRENIPNLGRIGDIVNVSDGYARNFLLPRNLVVMADQKNVASIEHNKRLLEKKRLAQKATAQEIADRLAGYSCTVRRKVGENDRLYGSVTVADIQESLLSGGFNLEKRSIQLDAPIKSLGVHSITVRLESDLNVSVKVWIVKEE